MSTQRFRLLLVVGTALLAAISVLILGPGRGAREDLGGVRADIGQVRTDLHATRGNTAYALTVSRRTLARLEQQLATTRQSLRIQQEGLAVARDSQHIAGATLDSTRLIREQTQQALSTVDRVVKALGPLGRLPGKIDSVVAGVQAGVHLARTTLGVAQQTLQAGQTALAVARTTLSTLQDSKTIQEQLLEVARQTLAQVTEINRKIPTPPVFPATAPTP